MPKPDTMHEQPENQWCPGCLNFGILTAVRHALEGLNIEPHRRCLVSGIGQAAKLPHYLPCNLFNGLHGRAVPAATAIHAANPRLVTVVTTGEGDCYGEGGNHFLHALRRNPDITLIVHDNRLYALTKGQASPTTPLGERTRLQILGTESRPFHPLATAIVHDCGFVARGFAGDLDHLAGLLAAAISYRGLSVVDVIQPCITWGRHAVSWYRDRVAPVGELHDPTDKMSALAITLEDS
ncbi:2-oxoacid ferredoxin oxidoreductase, partial [Candidatus Bipolaricaulota bacterium]|nr:2-oxoacid ferredoxin oxidoreductase [Candidatus Bipolaricaulota bacterium]